MAQYKRTHAYRTRQKQQISPEMMRLNLEKRRQEEERNRKAQEEAAKVYADFVESFKAPSYRQKEMRSNPLEENNNVKLRVPSVAKRKSAMTKPLQHVSHPFPEKQPPKRRKKKVKKAKLNIVSFMEEMKREKEITSRRLQAIKVPAPAPVPIPILSDSKWSDIPPLGVNPIIPLGHHDTGDPTTTNIYVGNLAPEVTEQILVREFGKFGDIASVKIMWPRTEEEHRRKRNCGFVSFMTRECAAEAMLKLQGVPLLGHVIRLGWGKSVTLPQGPLYVKNINPDGNWADPLPVVAQKEIKETFELPSGATKFEIEIPKERCIKKLVDKVAVFVSKLGHVFEKLVMEREINNPQFEFLFHVHTPEHMYYRWKTYSLSQGDDNHNWRSNPFQMIMGGPFWIPPTDKALDQPKHKKKSERRKKKSFKEKEKEKKGRLKRRDAEKFEDMLRSLNTSRKSIKEAMGFALDHAEEAREITEIITDSLSILETPIKKKIARLFLVSDILYNSSAPVKNASAYRTLFEKNIKSIFSSLHKKYVTITGRITANSIKQKVMNVLKIWQAWSLYSHSFLQKLEKVFIGNTETKRLEHKKQKKQVSFSSIKKPKTLSKGTSSNTSLSRRISSRNSSRNSSRITPRNARIAPLNSLSTVKARQKNRTSIISSKKLMVPLSRKVPKSSVEVTGSTNLLSDAYNDDDDDDDELVGQGPILQPLPLDKQLIRNGRKIKNRVGYIHDRHPFGR